MSGAISHSRLNLTFPATGAYKLCMSFPSEQQGGEDSEFELADVFRRADKNGDGGNISAEQLSGNVASQLAKVTELLDYSHL